MTDVLVVAGTKTSFVAAPALTCRLAVALVRPAAVAVIVAAPTAVGVSAEVALPPVGVIGDAGLNVPETPVTVNVIGIVAVLTVLPLAS